MGDALDDRLARYERFSSPVFGYVRKHPVFYLVPLAGSWREAMDVDGFPDFVRKLSELPFPKSRPAGIAPSAIGSHEYVSCPGALFLPHVVPPAPYAVYGKLRGIGAYAQAYEPIVFSYVVDPVGSYFSQAFVDEAISFRFQRFSLLFVFFSVVLEVPYVFFLLGIDGQGGAAVHMGFHDGPVDLRELKVAIRGFRSFVPLPVALEGVSLFFKEAPDGIVRNPESLGHKLFREFPGAFGSPSEGIPGISSRGRAYEFFQGIQYVRPFRFACQSPSSGLSDPSLSGAMLRRFARGFPQVPNSAANGFAVHVRGGVDHGFSSVPDGKGLLGTPHPPALFVEPGPELGIFVTNALDGTFHRSA